ncbi:MAG TPA: hypothetical protein PKC91_15055 [Ignavibacteria bacterium]|nr:hypothetical protein [Ignavibacteria bacterium]
MLKSSLLEILRTFSKQELIKFEDFVRSPYFNKKENVLRLFLEIKKYAPDFADANLEKEKIWVKVFPEIKYNYGIMKNLIFDLNKIAERFLHIQNYETKKFEQDINLLEKLNEKDLLRQYVKNLRSFGNETDKAPFDINYFYYKYLAEAKEHAFLFSSNTRIKGKNFCNPESMNENLISFFLVNFFVKNYDFLHESRFYDKPVDTSVLEAVCNFFENTTLRNNEFVLIYYYTLKIIMDLNDVGSFGKLKDLMDKNFKLFRHEEKFNFHLAMVNFCNFKVMNGSPSFMEELFLIYKKMVDHGFYSIDKDGLINSSMYANIVSTAGNLRKFEWADKFLLQFKNKLPASEKELYFSLANATLNIKKENYNEALRNLSTCKSINPIIKITIKRFQILIYYELGYFEELNSLIDASKHFISNDKMMTDSAKHIFSSFINMVQGMAELKSGNHKKKDREFKLQSLKNETLKNSATNKIWILEKLAELEKKIKT